MRKENIHVDADSIASSHSEEDTEISDGKECASLINAFKFLSTLSPLAQPTTTS